MTASSPSAGQRYAPLDMLARLVAFDTVSHKSNLKLIDFVEDYLAGWGVASVRLPNAAGDKAALFATVGPADRGGVLLSGHTDVVPVEGQAWSRDPFTLHVEDGRAYGRGAVDMKGFVALALALVPDFLAADLKTPIHLFFSYDEEVTCLGVVDGIARMGLDLPRPRAVIVGEPTSLDLADAHKGIRTFFTGITGFAAHSSKPHLGASAVHAGTRLAAFLVDIADRLEDKPDLSGRFEPPYDTVHVGKFHGGIARNILADRCDLSWEVRTLPGSDPEDVPARFAAFSDEVQARMRKTAPTSRIETVMSSDVPGLAPDPGSEAETLVMRLAGRNSTIAVAYATEAGHFQRAGLPTIVCGPGSIDQAHQPDEYITLEQFAAGEAFMRRLDGGVPGVERAVLSWRHAVVPGRAGDNGVVRAKSTCARRWVTRHARARPQPLLREMLGSALRLSRRMTPSASEPSFLCDLCGVRSAAGRSCAPQCGCRSMADAEPLAQW